ncbi:YecA family protein [Peribacillus deserti]|uniref:YecA family protein n=1 Tax=Peribacillus deserti TaxID=673318 RepID=UPI0021536DE0|nr:SEC-C metal-binding domain-containing protein [Peribacillus deserti]
MTFKEKLSPHLKSEDEIVRLFILQALRDYPLIPEEWTVQLIKNESAAGRDLASLSYELQGHSLNEEAVSLIIKHVKGKKDFEQYESLVNLIPPNKALQYKSELSPFITSSQWALYEVLVNGEEDQVWEEYGSHLAQLEAQETYDDALYRKTKLIAKTIAKKGWVDDNEIKFLLNENLNGDWFNFAGIFAVYWIGLLKKNEYINLLAGMLSREEEDLLMVEVADTLNQFQNDDVIKSVLPYARQGNVYALSVLAETKSSLAVMELKKLYQQFTQPEDKELVIEALAHQLSLEGRPEIDQFMKNESYQAVMIDLEKTVYGFYKLAGIVHPRLEYWKRAAEQKELSYQEYVNKPAVTEREKVGRNDPCPCGSGKKYKKCCGQ